LLLYDNVWLWTETPSLSLQNTHFQMTYSSASYNEIFLLKLNVNLTTRERDGAQFNGEVLEQKLASQWRLKLFIYHFNIIILQGVS